jgi:hypothetical protein
MRSLVTFRGAGFVLASVLAVLGAVAPARAAIVTAGGGPSRADWYPSMRSLSPATVADTHFGRLFDRTLPDHGQVYGQPLLAGGRLIVATERNDVYELDPRTGRILRSRYLAPPWRPVMPTTQGPYTCPDLSPYVGVTSTPVIDTTTEHGRGVVYLTAKTPVPASHAQELNQAEYLMYALRLDDLGNATGFAGGQPLVLNQFAAGDASGLLFDATFQLQRPALLDLGGQVYAGFGGLCDISPFFGWVVGVRAADGTLVNSWATPTATGARGAGIWMAGGGLVSDGPGRIFFSTGNGFDAPGSSASYVPSYRAAAGQPPANLSSSVVRLRALRGGALRADSFFTPCDAWRLGGSTNRDLDVSAGGAVALPSRFGNAAHRRLLVAGGKSGTIYLLDRRSLGGFLQGARSSKCPQGGDAVAGTLGPHGAVWSEPTAFPGGGGWLYVATEGPSGRDAAHTGRLDFYRGHLGTFRLMGTSQAVWRPQSGSPVVTSIGRRADSALVWGVTRNGGSGTLRVFSGVLGARTRSAAQLASFSVGPIDKFTFPGIGQDEIFVGGDGHVVAFGVRQPRG